MYYYTVNAASMVLGGRKEKSLCSSFPLPPLLRYTQSSKQYQFVMADTSGFSIEERLVDTIWVYE